MTPPPTSRAEIDLEVARAWDRGAWTLAQFVRVTRLPERTIEESCLRLYSSGRINFDPPGPIGRLIDQAIQRAKSGAQ